MLRKSSAASGLIHSHGCVQEKSGPNPKNDVNETK